MATTNWTDTPLATTLAEEGAFLRHQALALGLDDKVLRRAVRAGELVRVRHGAYTTSDLWTPATDVERHRTLIRAVLRQTPGPVAASHHSGCALHELDLWDVDLSLAHVTRLDGGAGRTDGGVVHHEGLSLDGDVERVGEHTVVRPVRAALESALLSGVERGLVTVDSGLRQGRFTRDELAEQHDLMRSWPGARPLELVTRLTDGRSGSVGETRSRHLLWSQGLPRPELQFEVYDGSRLVGVTDFAWPEYGLLGEFDGRVKYGRLLREGESPEDAVFREKRREDDLRQVTDWRMIRWVWADLYQPLQLAGRIRELMRRAA